MYFWVKECIYVLAFLQEIWGFSLLFTLSRESRDSRELKNQFPTFPGMKKSRETANSKKDTTFLVESIIT